MDINASTILSIGPAIAIFPLISSLILSAYVWTDPGKENTIPINAETIVINNPNGHALNSA